MCLKMMPYKWEKRVIIYNVKYGNIPAVYKGLFKLYIGRKRDTDTINNNALISMYDHSSLKSNSFMIRVEFFMYFYIN